MNPAALTEAYRFTRPAILHISADGKVHDSTGRAIYGAVRDVHALVARQVPAESVDALLEQARKNGAVQARLPCIDKAGRTFMAEVTITCNGDGFIWVAREHKEDDVQAHAARLLRLELMTHEVQEYGRLAVHGIRSPLMSLRWQAELTARGHPENPARSLELIDATLRVLDAALGFARIRLSQIDQLDARQLESQIDDAADTELRGALRCDGPLLVRAINELVGHAKRRGAGRIDVEGHSGSAFVIHITHDGEPLGPRGVKRIWTPFHDDPEGDAGIAMASARKIIHLHGGHVMARPDGFRIRLPVDGPAL